MLENFANDPWLAVWLIAFFIFLVTIGKLVIKRAEDKYEATFVDGNLSHERRIHSLERDLKTTIDRVDEQDDVQAELSKMEAAVAELVMITERKRTHPGARPNQVKTFDGILDEVSTDVAEELVNPKPEIQGLERVQIGETHYWTDGTAESLALIIKTHNMNRKSL